MGVDIKLYRGGPEQLPRSTSRLSDVNAVSSCKSDIKLTDPAAHNSVEKLTDVATDAVSAASSSRPMAMPVTEAGGSGVPVQQKGKYIYVN